MLDFTWKFFSKTGSIETYLLLKEMEKDVNDEMDQHEEELAHLDSNFLTRFVQTLDGDEHVSKVEGIVIRTTDYGETNKIVTIFSRELGKVSAMARGAKTEKPISICVAINDTWPFSNSNGIWAWNIATRRDYFNYERNSRGYIFNCLCIIYC